MTVVQYFVSFFLGCHTLMNHPMLRKRICRISQCHEPSQFNPIKDNSWFLGLERSQYFNIDKFYARFEWLSIAVQRKFWINFESDSIRNIINYQWTKNYNTLHWMVIFKLQSWMITSGMGQKLPNHWLLLEGRRANKLLLVGYAMLWKLEIFDATIQEIYWSLIH